MSSKSGFRLLSVLLIVAASVLTMDIAGPSFVSPANASGVSDWKNSGVTAVTVGREHTCAIETGVLYCWGAGTNGQLGYAPARVGFTIPPPTNQSKAIKVASAPGLGFTNTSVAAVSAGERSTCAIENRVVFCWGANSAGQLGNGRVEPQRNTAVKVSASNGFANSNVTAISQGGFVGCALEGGVVFCWGANNDGSVGDGTLVSKTVPHKVVDNDGFVNNGVTAIAAEPTSCAVRGGVLFCWGTGRYGQIGIGTTTDDNPRPRRVASVAGGFQNSSVSAVTVTEINVCATRLETAGGVTNPVMYCWGRGGTGNHGAGDMQLNVTRPRKVTPVAGGFTNSQVTSSHVGTASCAVDAGIVYCAGGNYAGQVGDGTTMNRLLLTRVLPGNGLLNNGAVTMVATRNDHTCAIERGSVFCWGLATNGRLGNGETSGIYTSAVSAASLPGAPTITGATVATNTATVTVSAGPGGVPTSYLVTASTSAGPAGSCTVVPPATSCTIEGLDPLTTYTFTATATSDQGTSPASARVSRTTGGVVAPGQPQVQAGNGQVTVTVSAGTGGGTPTGYIAYASPGGASCTILSPATSCTISPLTNGTLYTVTTAAFNDDGMSGSSPSATVIPGPPNAPLAPAVTVSDRSATVTVSPAPTGGTATSFTVTATSSAGPAGSCTVTPPATSCTIAGLTNGTTYTFTTTATNAVGTSAPSPSTTALVDILPIPRTDRVEVGATGVTVSVSTSPAGGTVQSYVVYIEPGGFTCSVTTTATATSCYIDGLTQGGMYTATTTATNGIGTSAPSPQLPFEFEVSGESQVGVAGIATPATINFGAATATFGFTPVGLEAGDVVASVTHTFTGVGATSYGPSTTPPTGGGVYTVMPSSAAFSAGSALNYSITYVPTTYTIVGVPATVRAEDKSKVYGDAAPTFTAVATRLQGTDALNVVTYSFSGNGYGPSTTPPINVGTYTITPTVVSLNPGTLGNYSFTAQTGTFTITPKSITVKAVDKSVGYGVALPSNEVIVSVGSLEAGDLLTGATYAYSTQPPVNVGGYTITPSNALITGGRQANYTITYATGTLTITRASVVVTAHDKSREFGTSDPTLTYTAVPDVTLVGSLTRAPGNDVGTYDITQGALASTANYGNHDVQRCDVQDHDQGDHGQG